MTTARIKSMDVAPANDHIDDYDCRQRHFLD